MMRNIREIAKLLNFSTDTVRRMLRENKVPGCKFRGVWKADPEKVVIALSNGYKPPVQRWPVTSDELASGLLSYHPVGLIKVSRIPPVRGVLK